MARICHWGAATAAPELPYRFGFASVIPAGVAALVGLLLVCSGTAAAQPGEVASVRADVDRQSMTTEDQLTLVITAEGRYDNIQVPPMTDWQIASTFESSQISILNGRRSAQKKLTRALIPTRAGTLTIPVVRLISGGQIVAESKALQIQVRAPAAVPPQSPREAANLQRHANETIFVHTTTSKESPYVGEPFVLTYELWVRVNVSVTDRGFGKTPSFDAFSATDLQAGGALGQSRKRLGGAVYNVITMAQTLLVPLREGKQRIEPIERQLLTGDLFNRRQFSAKSPAMDIQVRPLPEAGRPAAYSTGQIGQFSMSAELDRTEVQAGERVVLTVTVSGTGNLAAIKAPAFPSVAGLSAELLPSRDQPAIVTDGTGMHGEVSFAYIVVPTQAGRLTIPPFELGTFDSAAGEYRLVRSEPLELVATGGSALLSDSKDGEQGLRPFLSDMSLSNDRRSDAGAGPLFWIALALPLLLFGAAEVRTRVRLHRAENASIYRHRDAATNALQAIAGLHGKPPAAALAGLAGVLERFLSDRFGVAAGATRDAMARQLGAAGAPAAEISQLVELLDTCDFARFAPSSVNDGDASSTIARAKAAIQALAEQAPASSPAKETT